jgi:hypothetical protein
MAETARRFLFWNSSLSHCRRRSGNGTWRANIQKALHPGPNSELAQANMMILKAT